MTELVIFGAGDIARLAHYFVYAAGVPMARTLTFTAGWLAQIAIILAILRSV